MCGIFGWQFRPNYRPPFWKKAILAHALGRENLTRGRDSWGWYLADTQEIVKDVGEIVGHTYHAAPQSCVLGHTRHGTQGAKTYENAHPFEFGNIIGAHNGGIGNHDWLNSKRKEKGLPELTCDSMHLIDAIDQGLEKVKDLVGWGAVEWVDLRNPGTVRLAILSSQGELNMAQCQEGIIWSSSLYDLKKSMTEAGFRGVFLKTDEGDIYDIHNGCVRMSKERMAIGSRHGHQTFFGGATSPYGSQGTLLDSAREEYIRDMKGKNKKKEKKIERGEALKNMAGDAEIIKATEQVCTACYDQCDDQGKCPRGHNASTVVIDM